MISALRQRLRLIEPQWRLRWLALMPLGLAAAVIEAAGAGAVFALVAVAQDPNGSGGVAWIGAVLRPLPSADAGGRLLWLCGLIAAYYVARAAYLLAVRYAANRVTGETSAALSSHMLDLYLRAPHTVRLQRHSSQAITNVAHSAFALVDGVMGSTFALTMELLTIAALTTVLAVAAPLATLAAALLLATLVVGAHLATRAPVGRLGERSYALERSSLKTLQDGLAAATELKLLGREGLFAERFSNLQSRRVRLAARRAALEDAPRLLLETVCVLALVLVVAIVQWSSAPQTMLPVLGVFGYAAFRIIPSANRILSHMARLRFGLSATQSLCDDYIELSDHARDLEGRAGCAPLPMHHGLELDSVTFRYGDDGEDTISDATLRIDRGQVVALVGPSGGGKSTLIGLMLGLLPPSSGRVLVDGEDVASRLADWQRGIGYVPQSYVVLDDTVRHNVALGIADDRIDDRRVRRALTAARLDGFVAALPDGLDTRVGEHGARLSGGQAQRLAIARALYDDPELLIFDEATSNLDMKLEREIIEDLASLGGTKTLVIVAHRLSAVRHCDRLVFVRDGRVEATGSFDTLLATNAAFRAMSRTPSTKRSPQRPPNGGSTTVSAIGWVRDRLRSRRTDRDHP